MLEDATKERLAADGPTTIWMSGGWDSTSVFAAGNSALGRENHASGRLLPVSMTYPADDVGNEDAYIRAVAERWGAPIRWVDTEQIPLFASQYAGIRDDPMAQAFESQLRNLSRTSLELGPRIALDGFGGDHLFSLSSGAIVADHLFYGRWSELWWSWRTWGASGREFVRSCLLPHFSPALLDWIGSVRGRPLEGFWDKSHPPWIIHGPDIDPEPATEFERQPGEGAAEFELRMGINSSFVPRVLSWNHALGLDEGVQLRGPLFDPRVISFAVTRPLSDRGAGGDGKRLLRRAMSGLIPESVLAPRSRKTGTPAGYFRRQFQATLPAEMESLFGRGRQSILEQMGLLNRDVFRAALEEYLSTGRHLTGAMLHLTLETERWLATRSGVS